MKPSTEQSLKTVYIIRHAKTESALTPKADFERKLTDRGQNDAAIMGRRLKERNIIPDLILSSTAFRAEETAMIIAGETSYDKRKIRWEQNLYMSDAATIDAFIRNINDGQVHTLFLIAHNNGITDYVNYKIDAFTIDNVPTCGIAGFTLDITHWKDNLYDTPGSFLYFDYPKNT